MEIDSLCVMHVLLARSTVACYVTAVRDEEDGVASEGKLGYSMFPMVSESSLLRNQSWFECSGIIMSIHLTRLSYPEKAAL